METILVTGATGKLGNAVIRTLLDKKFNVRAAARKTTKIKWTDRVQPVIFDYEDHGLFKAALDNVSNVFLIAPPLDPQAHAKLVPFIDRAKEMGVSYIVFTSAMTVDSEDQNPLRIIERHLMESGLDYTILRPNFFMENFSSGWLAPMIASGSIRVPAGDAGTSFISIEDIALVAAACFQEKRYGEECNLTGRESLGYGEAAKIISDACGRTVTYKPITEAEMTQNARQMGVPESAIRYMAELFDGVRKGRFAEISGVIKEVTGKPPVSFKEFAQKNADIWKMRKAA